MIKDIPANVARVVLAQGAVYLRTTEAAIDSGLSLSIGEAASHFSAVPDDEIATFGIPLSYRPEFDPRDLGAAAGTRDKEGEAPAITAMLNELEDWKLEDHPTLQFRLTQSSGPVRFELTSPILLPPHGKNMEFSALLGAHRAEARLHLKLVDDEGTVLDETDLLFDEERHGGIHLQGYKEVTRSLPAHPDGPSHLYLTVLYDSFTGDEGEPEPYLFVADPQVRRKIRPDAIPAEDLHNNPGGEGLKMAWASAPLPGALGPGEVLQLVSPEGTATLKTGTQVRIRMLQNHGHTVNFEADTAGRYQFHIDGKPAFESFIGTESTAVRIPNTYFNGETRMLSVWDTGGTRRLHAAWMLMPRLLTPYEVLWEESRAPYDGTLAAQASHRYRALKTQMDKGPDAETAAQIGRALAVLEGGHDKVRLEPLKFPQPEAPDVSVVIPAYNKVAVTYLALASLLVAPNEASFEVIVVDDASDDETSYLERIVEGITVIHNESSQRFIRACNAGAEVARGKYVVLLNNDVEVTEGWLDALIDGFDRFDNVGLVGSKLLYPNGLLQDAGGIVWGNGNPWQYGNKQNPNDPRFSYARQVDYLSGAALMTTKEIWDELGGLSDYLEPMYFEDTDFAFKVREAGYSTWFVPSSVIYHYEGMTSGTDTGSGFKRYQEINRPKFKRRWAQAFRSHGRQGERPDLEKDRGITGRVLFVDYASPRPDRDAGSYAAIEEIKLVQALGYKVTFLPANLAHLGSYTEDLERMGVEMIHAPYYLSVTQFLEERGDEFDAIYITRYYVAQNLLKHIEEYAPQAKVLFNNADLHFLRELRAGLAAQDPGLVAGAAETRMKELAVMRDVDVVLSYNETEHAIIESHTDGAVKVVRCPWVVDLPAAVPGREGRSGLSFLGNYKHLPNAEGVEWFAAQVVPLLDPEDPDLALWLYGAAMPDSLRALESAQIRPVGFVDDVADAYNRHRIFVAPLLSGAGIKGKVLSALAHGVPCILSPVAAEGIGLRHNHDCMIARTPQDWADAVGALRADDVLWDQISENARSYVQDQYSFEAGLKMMRAAFEAADLFSA